MARVLSRNTEAGIVHTVDYDHAGEQLVLHTTQDVTEIIEDNKRSYNTFDQRARFRDINRFASVPVSLYFDMKKKGILGDQKKMKEFFNDPENRHFRTRPGRI